MSKIIVDLLSDTHNQHDKFTTKGGEILIHAGDCTGRGTLKEAVTFLDWYKEQDYSHLVLIPGNHDFCFEENPKELKFLCDNRGIILLNDSGYVAKESGQEIRIWGSPIQPWFHDWAFNRQRGADIKKHWDMIPNDTEILVTHGPPMGILDKVAYRGSNLADNVGCADLLEKIKQTEVKLHVFGHIHEGRGQHYDGPITYVNASSLDRMYYPQSKKPIRVTREVFQDGSIGYIV
jgi:Icc-related predicted phosphoesterase